MGQIISIMKLLEESSAKFQAIKEILARSRLDIESVMRQINSIDSSCDSRKVRQCLQDVQDNWEKAEKAVITVLDSSVEAKLISILQPILDASQRQAAKQRLEALQRTLKICEADFQEFSKSCHSLLRELEALQNKFLTQKRSDFEWQLKNQPNTAGKRVSSVAKWLGSAASVVLTFGISLSSETVRDSLQMKDWKEANRIDEETAQIEASLEAIKSLRGELHVLLAEGMNDLTKTICDVQNQMKQGNREVRDLLRRSERAVQSEDMAKLLSLLVLLKDLT